MDSNKKANEPTAAPVAGSVAETVSSMVEIEQRAEADLSMRQRAVERVTAALGRPRAIDAVLIAVALWIALNVTLKHPLDPPPFYWLQGFVGLSALVMTMLILTTQNRSNALSEQRARLALQISLLTEKKVAKTIELIELLRRDDPSIANRFDPVAIEMTMSPDPTAVVEAMERNASGEA